MIDSLWTERRSIVRVTVPLKGARRRAIYAVCRALERGSAAAPELLPNDPLIDQLRPPAIDCFADAYPEQPAKLRHGLCDHPLLQLDIAGRAGRGGCGPRTSNIIPATRRSGSIPADDSGNGLSIQETIRRIEECGSWMVLKFVEQDAIYRALLRRGAGASWRRRCARDRARCCNHRGVRLHLLAGLGRLRSTSIPSTISCSRSAATKAMSIFPADDEELAPMRGA